MATKDDLIDRVSSKIHYISNDDIRLAIDFIFDFFKAELASSNRISIRHFGSFSIRPRKYAGKAELYKIIYYRSAKNAL